MDGVYIKMKGTIDMKLMRYINLFSRVAKVQTTSCFVYNNVIVFAVPKSEVSRAVGKNGENVKKLGETLRKKIKVIAQPNTEDTEDMKRFVADVISPADFSKIEISDGVLKIGADRTNKAALIGRNRAREKELGEILSNFFGFKKVRVV